MPNVEKISLPVITLQLGDVITGTPANSRKASSKEVVSLPVVNEKSQRVLVKLREVGDVSADIVSVRFGLEDYVSIERYTPTQEEQDEALIRIAAQTVGWWTESKTKQSVIDVLHAAIKDNHQTRVITSWNLDTIVTQQAYDSFVWRFWEDVNDIEAAGVSRERATIAAAGLRVVPWEEDHPRSPWASNGLSQKIMTDTEFYVARDFAATLVRRSLARAREDETVPDLIWYRRQTDAVFEEIGDPSIVNRLRVRLMD